MTMIAILEGDDYSNDVDVLGFGFKEFRTASKKIIRPTKKMIRPVLRKVDRTLKKTPVVRTVYRGGIAASYYATGRRKKGWGALKRTKRSAYRDYKGAKKLIIKMSVKVLKPLAKSGVSKLAAKVMVIPTMTAKAAVLLGPWTLPIVPVAVNEAINIVWRNIKKVVKKVYKPAKKTLKRISTNIGGKGPESQKMTSIPSPSGGMGFKFNQFRPPTPVQPPQKKAGGMIALLALAPLALMM